jgi:lysine 2,3-aminomutase
MTVYKNTKRLPAFENISDEDWNSWQWQYRHRLQSEADVVRVLNPSEEILQGIRKSTQVFKKAITPYYANLVDVKNPHCPVGQQALSCEQETFYSEDDLYDPLGEDKDAPVPGLTHRYPDRVLLLVTDSCSMYCRHCTRRRKVGQADADFDNEHIQKGISYIAAHPEVRDVVISGGDPLTLSDTRIEWVVKSLREIPHVEIIRIGTRMPVVLPMRITEELVMRLKKYHPIYISTHFNHSKEITPEAIRACNMLADHGFPVQNQSVLLRGVNDCPHVMKELVHNLLKMRVRPYYLYQCDLSKGISHFRTHIGKGIEIIESLRGHTSGLAIPTFVVDLPGGGGKVPVMPNYLISMSDDKAVLRNFEGAITTYHSPHRWTSICGKDEACHNPKNQAQKGPAMLMQKRGYILEPVIKPIEIHTE